MRKVKAWLVSDCGGQWSDAWEMPVIAFADKARAKECADKREERGAPDLFDESSGECYYTIIHALGLSDTSREDGGAALYAHLADLIDPDTTTDTTKSPEVTTKCDRDALLALAEEMDMDAGCHAYVDDYVVYDYARRIREVLGAGDD